MNLSFFLYHIFLLRSISSTVSQSWHYDLFFLTISLYCYLCYYFTAITSDSTIYPFDLCNSFSTQQPSCYFKMKIISGLNSAENSSVLLYLKEKKKASHITLYLPTLPLFYVPVLYSIGNWMYQSFLEKMLYKSVNRTSLNYFWPPVGFHVTISVSQAGKLRDNFISFILSPIKNNQSPITGSFTLEIPLIWCIFTLI